VFPTSGLRHPQQGKAENLIITNIIDEIFEISSLLETEKNYSISIMQSCAKQNSLIMQLNLG